MCLISCHYPLPLKSVFLSIAGTFTLILVTHCIELIYGTQGNPAVSVIVYISEDMAGTVYFALVPDGPERVYSLDLQAQLVFKEIATER